MTEREIFLDALDQEDPAARAAYLDAACAGRPELRRRIEELLKFHRQDDAFLEVSALRQLADDERVLTALPPSRDSDALGRLDHYEVLEVVGRGATGVVLKARDTKLQRIVAIQLLASRLAASATARARFVREAQAVAAVRDDHVVAIYAVSEDGPAPYLVMEYIHGTTLEERLKQTGSLDSKEIFRVGMQVANGLAAAHAQGVIHRDIKPGNILLENGVQRIVKITDFGLAGIADDANVAHTGVLAGTPAYMSPEQARGEPTDHRSDQFSLGSVLYTLCAGRPPFRGNTTSEVLSRVRADAPQPVREINPGVPEWLSGLIGRLHARELSGRPASAREVADLLAGQLALLRQPPLMPPPAAAPVASVQTAQATPRLVGVWPSRRLTIAICLVGLLAALAALAVVLMGWPRGGSDVGEVGETPPANRGPVEPLELRRQDIPPMMLALAGGGDPAQAPPELAAVLGDGRFLLPRIGYTGWMEQSPDGRLLAVPLDEDVVLFQVPEGTYLQTLKGPGARVAHVTFSRDSQLLAASTWRDGVGVAVRVWDLDSRRELFTDPQTGPNISGAAVFSPDGQRLLTDGGERLLVRDARSGQELQAVELRPGGIPSLCFTPDGRRLAVAVWHGKGVKVFDWDGEKLGAVRTLDNRSPVGAVVYSPDGKFLASGDEREIKLRNAETLEEIRTVAAPAHQLAFASDSRILLAALTTGPVKVVHTFARWDVVADRELPLLSVEVSADRDYAFHYLSRDGKVLFVVPGSNATYIRAIDPATGKERFPREGHTAPLNAVAISPDGGTLASAGEDRALKLWDLAAGRVRHTLRAHTDAVYGLAFSPDGNRLASGSRDSTIVLWDADSGAELRRLTGHSRSFSRLCFSPDGRTLAAGGESGLVKRWDVDSGKEDNSLPGHIGVVRCVAFSPDGKLLASGGEDKTVRLHDLAGGGSRTFTMPSAVNDVAFSADGRTLAAIGDAPEAAVRLWDIETGKETTWKGHTGHVHGVAFSPLGSLLATCAEDGTVRLWDRDAAPAVVRTIGPGPFGGAVRTVAFTPDGRYLATANANGTVYLFRVGPRSP